jgi:hypothetical protein
MKGISRKDFDIFTKEMWKRLKMGEKKYGTQFINDNIKKAMIEEATDLSNYSLMLYLQATKFNKKIK